MKELFRGLWAVAAKELLHIRRDKTTLVFALFTPMMQLLILGFAVNFDVRHVPTVIVDLDRSRDSRALIQTLSNTQYLEITGSSASSAEAAELLSEGEARVAVVIPPDFSRRLGSKNPPQVKVMLDGSDSQVAGPVRQAFAGVGRSPSGPDIRLETLYNPTSRTVVYTIPGLMGVILQLVTVTLTAFALVRERESGTLDQLMVTPVGRMGLLLGKLIPYAGLAALEFLGVLGVARILFDVPLVGSFFLLAALSTVFIVAALSLGLLLSTLAQNQAQALQFSILLTMPSVLLSGYIAPRETLPGPLALVSEAIPVTHFIAIARGIMVRGAGLGELWGHAVALGVIAALLLTIAASRFRKTVG